MAAQGYKEIQLTTPLKDSLPLILHNDEASITCSAGIVFPEDNLKEGMLCFRSDLQRLTEHWLSKLTWLLTLMTYMTEVLQALRIRITVQPFTSQENSALLLK